MPGLKLKHFVDIRQRPVEPADEIIDCRPFVPGFGEVGRVLDDGVEDIERLVVLAGVHALARLFEQKVVGRAAGTHP